VCDISRLRVKLGLFQAVTFTITLTDVCTHFVECPGNPPLSVKISKERLERRESDDPGVI
jgi:hypothetical protein